MNATRLTPAQAAAIERQLTEDALLVALKFEYQYIARAYMKQRANGVGQYDAMDAARKEYAAL